MVAETRLVETRTSEIATNVTPEQVRYLPQNQRNFLNFAALAPGVQCLGRREPEGGHRRRPRRDADQRLHRRGQLQERRADGGVVGQDSSRGSPFPQNAVQEFQVLTQNFKAEHEKAASR